MIKNKINKYIDLSILIITIGIFFVAANLTNFFLFEAFSWDVTPDKKYTLSAKTKDFLKKNTAPLVIKLYVSKDLDKDKKLGAYAIYIRKLLEEYKRKSSGAIDLIVVETVPFENSQAEAEKSGVKNFYDSDEFIYFGASFTNKYGKVLSIPKFLPERISFAERDITGKLSVLANKKDYIVGIMSPYFDMRNEKGEFSLPVAKYVEDLGYKVKEVYEYEPAIDDDVDVLLITYPVVVNFAAVYATDQFLMNGGKVIIYFDAYSVERYKYKNNFIRYESGFNNFLRNFNVEYVADNIVGNDNNFDMMKLGINQLDDSFKMVVEFDETKKHQILNGVNELYLNRSGYFRINDVDENVTILFEAENNPKVLRTEFLHYLTYENYLQEYRNSDEIYPLAVLFEGKFNSLFQKNPFSKQSIVDRIPAFLASSVNEGKLLLVADNDILSEELLNRRAFVLNNKYRASDNFKFLANTLDYMSGSGFVSVDLQKKERMKKNLIGYFEDVARESFEQKQSHLYEKLITIKKQLKNFKYKLENKMQLSLKEIKENEGFVKDEVELEYELQKLLYDIKERTNVLYNIFAMIVILGLTFLVVFAGFVVYRKIDIRLMKK